MPNLCCAASVDCFQGFQNRRLQGNCFYYILMPAIGFLLANFLNCIWYGFCILLSLDNELGLKG